MSTVIEWRGTEDQQHRERMNACRERSALYGDDCEGDGSCCECEMDMAEALETPASKRLRAAERTALPDAPAAEVGKP